MADKNTLFYPKQLLNCGGSLLDLSTVRLMGILNTTPDSFYDGGFYKSHDEVLKRVNDMLKAGADIVDVGGMSSRPGAEAVSEAEELERVIPVIEAIHNEFPQAIISADTYRSAVAQEAISAGATIINDISAGNLEEGFLETVARLKTPYILMHMQGKPDTMQHNPDYKNVVEEVLDFFVEKIHRLRSLGVNDIVLDPGFGFGKTVEQNYQLLHNLDRFKVLGLPILAGISRKSMICKALSINPDKALNGTTALHMAALLNGANILRVHDVKEAKEVIQLAAVYLKSGN